MTSAQIHEDHAYFEQARQSLLDSHDLASANVFA